MGRLKREHRQRAQGSLRHRADDSITERAIEGQGAFHVADFEADVKSSHTQHCRCWCPGVPLVQTAQWPAARWSYLGLSNSSTNVVMNCRALVPTATSRATLPPSEEARDLVEDVAELDASIRAQAEQ